MVLFGTEKKDHAHQVTVSSVEPIPLHQAIDGVSSKSADGESKCLFFTRFKQSSSTFRYVGGTAEHLWAWCEGEDRAVALTSDYRGTSRSASIYRVGLDDSDSDPTSYLLYISDRREAEDGTWIPGTLNLWAAPLPSRDDLYNTAYSDADGEADHVPNKMQHSFPLTSVDCEYNGMSLMEYSIDEVTGNIILRIGADLHLVERKKVVEVLERGGRRRLDVAGATGTESAKKTPKKKKNNVNEDANSPGGPSSPTAVPKAKSASPHHLAANRLPISIWRRFLERYVRAWPWQADWN